MCHKEGNAPVLLYVCGAQLVPVLHALVAQLCAQPLQKRFLVCSNLPKASLRVRKQPGLPIVIRIQLSHYFYACHAVVKRVAAMCAQVCRLKKVPVLRSFVVELLTKPQ